MDTGETRSLTYDQLATALGIDRESARRRAIRSGWARVTGNDGRARVTVPLDELPTPARAMLEAAEGGSAPPAPLSRLAATVERLSGLLEAAHAREAELLAQRDEARGLVASAEARTASLEAEARVLREALELERGTLQRALDARERRFVAAMARALQAAITRAGGLLHRRRPPSDRPLNGGGSGAPPRNPVSGPPAAEAGPAPALRRGILPRIRRATRQ